MLLKISHATQAHAIAYQLFMVGQYRHRCALEPGLIRYVLGNPDAAGLLRGLYAAGQGNDDRQAGQNCFSHTKTLRHRIYIGLRRLMHENGG